MASSTNFYLQFASNKQSFHIRFQEQQAATKDTVVVNGKNYSLSGDSFKIEWLKTKIPELRARANLSLKNLEYKLSSLGVKEIQFSSEVQKAHSTVLNGLGIEEKKEWGNVLVLVGHSSGGKSTIISAIREPEPERAEEGSDLTGANYIYEFMENNHEHYGVSKEDWQHLHSVLMPREDNWKTKANWHIHDAVDEGKYAWKEQISIEDKERATKTATALREPVHELVNRKEDIDIIVMDKVLDRAAKGQNTVFDTLYIDKVTQHPLSKKTAVKSVLIYCPFHTLTERVAERNRKAVESGNIQEIRAGTFPLAQFSELFGPRQPSNRDEDVIDIVTRKVVEEDFDANYDAGIEDMRRRDPEALKKMTLDGSLERDKAKAKKELLTALGFNEFDSPSKSVELAPRKRYDIYINTNDISLGKTPLERGRNAAKNILGTIK